MCSVFILAIALASQSDGFLFTEPDPIVNMTYGQLRGKIVSTRRGKCDVYLGVPFAAPPVGPLRWKKPQPPTPWPGIRDAKEFGPRCVQVVPPGHAHDHHEGFEDCLYLNVFVPRSATSAKGLPVMVAILGGAYAYGSTHIYGEEGPCENLATRGVVLVIVQYRLLLYGFFSTGDSAAPGNYGLWDQIEALKWVQQNIAYFGGDPKKVTIFGNSAGGCCVSYLTYTSVAKDLFHQYIIQSGTALSRDKSGLSDLSVSTTKKLANAANCESPDSNAVVDCLRRLPTDELQKFYLPLPNSDDFFKNFRIRLDGEMFNESVFRDASVGKPAIIGVVTKETAADPKDIPMAQELFTEKLEVVFAGNDARTSQVLNRTARYVYIDSKGDRNDNTFVCQQVAKLHSDYSMYSAAANEATLKTISGSPVWVYNFDYYNQDVFSATYPFQKGAPHAEEVCYLFHLPHLDLTNGTDGTGKCPSSYKGEHRKIADYLGEMWTNFAKNGNPSPKQLNWLQFINITHANAIQIRSELSTSQLFYVEAANFWNSLTPGVKGDLLVETRTGGQNQRCEPSRLMQLCLLVVTSLLPVI